MKMITEWSNLKTAVYIDCIGCPDAQAILETSLLRGMSDVGTPSQYRVRSSPLTKTKYNDALSIGVPYLEVKNLINRQPQIDPCANTLSTHTGERVCLC